MTDKNAVKIVFATGNQGKVREIREIMAEMNVNVVTMKEEGIHADPDENGTTFAENALIKAREIAKYTDAIVMADDSGLEVDYMNKEPGVYSARWMGYDTSYDIKNQAILDRLGDIPKEQRTARYVCAVAAVMPDGKELLTVQNMEGFIGWKPEGTNGFGFDPIFYVDEYHCSAASLTPEQKNEISHRGKALREISRILADYLAQ